MTTTATERRFRVFDLIGTDANPHPERVTVSGTGYVPFMLHVVYGDDNTIARVSLSAWRVRSEGLVDIEHDTTVSYTTENWVEEIAYADAPKPVAPGNYVRYSERNMTYPLVYSLSEHGVWYVPSGALDRDELPSTLIAR